MSEARRRHKSVPSPDAQCALCDAGAHRRRDGLYHIERDFEGQAVYVRCKSPLPIRFCSCPAGPGFGIRKQPHICEKCYGVISKPLKKMRNGGVPEDADASYGADPQEGTV
jgi:hypothetical protein